MIRRRLTSATEARERPDSRRRHNLALETPQILLQGAGNSAWSDASDLRQAGIRGAAFGSVFRCGCVTVRF